MNEEICPTGVCKGKRKTFVIAKDKVNFNKEGEVGCNGRNSCINKRSSKIQIENDEHSNTKVD